MAAAGGAALGGRRLWLGGCGGCGGRCRRGRRTTRPGEGGRCRSAAAGAKATAAKRAFSPAFYAKHIRNASLAVGDHKALALTEFAVLKKRAALSAAIQTNTVIFMNSYQAGLFCGQNHANQGVTAYGTKYESTTMFPALEVSSSGNYVSYGAVKFTYGATRDANGVDQITHFFEITKGDNPVKGSVGGATHVIL